MRSSSVRLHALRFAVDLAEFAVGRAPRCGVRAHFCRSGFSPELVPAGDPLGRKSPCLDRLSDGAPGFAIVPTVTEATVHREFSDVGEVEAVLNDMTRREDGPLVAKLPREPGRRESRYVHLFGTPGTQPEVELAESTPVAMAEEGADPGRLAVLEREVATLRREIERLQDALGIERESPS